MSFAVGPRISLPQPPRWVPVPIRIKLCFGGGLNQVGWFLLGIGSLLAWAMQMPQSVYQWIMFHGEIITAQATVLSAEETNVSVNKTRVYYYTFKFQDQNENHQGFGYETGQSLHAGQMSTAEYPAGRPDLARLKGRRRTLLPWPALIFGVIPLVGLLMVYWGFTTGRRNVKLLASGEQTTGKLVNKEPTNLQVNNRTVYKLTFEFHTETHELCQTTVKTHHTELLQDEAEEILFYLPNKPSVAVLLDDLPGSPRVDELGEFCIDHQIKSWFNLLLPLLTIFGNVVYLYYRYSS